MTCLTVAISPCPNDTCVFGSWILGKTTGPAGRDSAFLWRDVQELNEGALEERWDVVKVSAAVVEPLKTSYTLLPCGGAFGLEHGPKLVVPQGATKALKRIGVPGINTTALLLLRAALPKFEPVPMRFDHIVQAVKNGHVDAGLLIHETALVYAQYGLALHLDLGAWWREKSAGLPLPLGGIMVRKSLGADCAAAVQAAISASITHGQSAPEDIQALVQAFAQELEAQTLKRHIAAYVNTFTADMGIKGTQAYAYLQSLTQPATRSASA